MSFTPDALQQLLLWRLAVSDEGGDFLKDIEGGFPPEKRKPLVREGLVEEEKRKPPAGGQKLIHLRLTDKGWRWCQESLADFKAPPRAVRLTGPILERLLAVLHGYFTRHGHTGSLGQLIQRSRPKEGGPEASNGRPADLEQAIREACLALGEGRENVRVRLADLRARLGGVPRPALDEALLAMDQAGTLSLYALDDPREVGAADREAALRTRTGYERHIVYFGGRAS